VAISTDSTLRLVADIGGTNSRIALYNCERAAFDQLQTFRNADFKCFEDVLDLWLEQYGGPTPTTACIAIAAAPTQERVTMINTGWSFTCRELQVRYGFKQCSWINDFVGNAYALPHLQASDLYPLQASDLDAAPATDKAGPIKLATVGPGTGLGGATLALSPSGATAWAAEPGFMGLSPCSAIELELFSLLMRERPSVYAELLVSGPGLLRIYQTLGEIRGEASAHDRPSQVTQAALAGNCRLSELSLSTFCALLGSVCGDFVLANGAFSGLYLAGGIVPNFIPFLANSDFLSRFSTKGALQTHLKAVPIWVITAEQPGLIGAAHAPL